uniref:Auxin-responsive protein n=1 Tax=Rhizophora mucronata TaxID=61149 RepID=A0A2P2IU56_RHIMU
MLTLTKKAPGPTFPSTSSLFFELVANEFFLNDFTGGQPTTCALAAGTQPLLSRTPVWFNLDPFAAPELSWDAFCGNSFFVAI